MSQIYFMLNMSSVLNAGARGGKHMFWPANISDACICGSGRVHVLEEHINISKNKFTLGRYLFCSRLGIECNGEISILHC